MRSKIFARRADNIQKWMNAAIRCQTRTRSASSQSSVITEGNPPNSIPNISSTSTEQADVSTERLLDVLKRILGPRKHEMWKSALRHLQDGHGKRNCLGVLDMSQPGSPSLVGALIGGREISAAVRQALDSRWTSLPDSTSRLVIRNGGKIAKFGSILEVPSEALAKFNAEVLEVRDPEYAVHLVLTHLPVVVLRPGMNPNLPSIRHKKQTIFLVEYTDSTAVAANEPVHNEQFPRFLAFNRVEPNKIVPQLYNMLTRISLETSPQSLKQAALRGMLDECSAQLELSLRELEAIKVQAVAFSDEGRSLLDQLRAKFEAIDFLAELQDNKTHLRNQIAAFGRFRFWEMDEFGEELQAYVIANYGVDLERKLEWFAGSMAAVQERIQKLTNDYLVQIPEALGAASLVNQVHRLESTQLPIPPSCFTSPILNRRRQLASIATPYMQSRYLRRVYAAMIAAPLVAGSPALLWANGMLDGSLALPAAILGLLFCLRHVSKAWEKARTKWLADYDRIQVGLSEDIQKIVQDMLEKRLKTIPLAALEGSTLLVAQREETIKALATEVGEAESVSQQ